MWENGVPTFHSWELEKERESLLGFGGEGGTVRDCGDLVVSGGIVWESMYSKVICFVCVVVAGSTALPFEQRSTNNVLLERTNEPS